MTNSRLPRSTKIEKKFAVLWQRAKDLSVSSTLNVSVVRELATQMGLNIKDVRQEEVGIFQTSTAIVLETEDGTACFPLDTPECKAKWARNNEAWESIAREWEKMEWFAPLWIAQGETSKLLKAVKFRSREEAIKLFDYHMSTNYTLAFQAMCIAQFMTCSKTLSKFAPLAREAYLAFYSGHRASSIAALIPVMEGAIKQMTGSGPDGQVLHEVDRLIDGACARAADLHYQSRWVPDEFLSPKYLFGQDERVYVFETYRRWLHRSFFENTSRYDGATWLNRHVFAHGMSAEWHNSSNFERLVVALATLAAIESWHDGSNSVSLFMYEMNEDSTLLWQQALLRCQIQMNLLLHEQKQFHAKGRLVPELPEDDGVMLRNAILSQECIDDLVRPLRGAGWSVKVDEPDEQALYVRVHASSDAESFTVALLYSCATDNALYKELAKTAVAVLYRGSPYHQQSYAYGIEIHVGPVTGWSPPLAPHRSNTFSKFNSYFVDWYRKMKFLCKNYLPK